MPTPSPTCEVKDGAGAYGATTNGVNVTALNTITIHLVSEAGVSTWGITCIGTDEQLVAATVTAGLTINSLAKTATFTAGEAGSSYVFQSVVNGGVDVNGTVQASYTTTFKISVLTAGGYRTGALNETTENHSTFGWLGLVNSLIRSGPLPVSATTGQTVTWNGSQWAASTNFSAQTLVTTGRVQAGGLTRNVSVKTASYTLTTADDVVRFNLSGDATATLPAVPATCMYTICAGTLGGFTLTIDANGKQLTTAGHALSATTTLTTNYSSLTFVYDGTIWFSVGQT